MKDNQLILIILLILLIVWAYFTYNSEPEVPADPSTLPCNQRPLRTCWTDCGPTFLPDRTIFDPSESTQTRVLECGVNDECSPSAENYPFTEQQTCTLVPEPSEPTEPIVEVNGNVIGIEQLSILGCTDNIATNYNPQANTDDGSCTYNISPNDFSTFGCCYPLSPNFDPACASSNSCNCVAYLC